MALPHPQQPMHCEQGPADLRTGPPVIAGPRGLSLSVGVPCLAQSSARLGRSSPPRSPTDSMKDHSKTKAQLELRLKELIERAEHVDEDLGQRGPRDWDDNALESEGDEVLDAVGLATVAEIKMIRDSLIAIDEGTYGVCTACGIAISAERLEALPEATQCRRCA